MARFFNMSDILSYLFKLLICNATNRNLILPSISSRQSLQEELSELWGKGDKLQQGHNPFLWAWDSSALAPHRAILTCANPSSCLPCPPRCISHLDCIPRARLQPYLCTGILGIPAGSSGQAFGIADRVAESRNQSGFSMGGENQPSGTWN